METNSTAGTVKKNIKDYILEGLMIFVAVSMGFIAENMRENIADKEKEIQYAESLCIDLKTDETKLPELINWLSKQITESDSLFVLLNKTPNQDETKRIYSMLRDLIRGLGIELFITKRTFTQLNGTGDFRLIRPKNVSDGISDYYRSVEATSYLQKVAHENKFAAFQLFSQTLNATDYNAAIDSEDNVILPQKNVTIDLTNKEAVNNLLLHVAEIKGISIGIKSEIEEIKVMSTHLRETVQRQYGLQKD